MGEPVRHEGNRGLYLVDSKYRLSDKQRALIAENIRLKDEYSEDPSSLWEKSTIRYILDNTSKIMQSIRASMRLKTRGRIDRADVDDVFQEVVEYFRKQSDFDPMYAEELKHEKGSETAMTIENYIGYGIKNCVKRFNNTRYTIEKELINKQVYIDEDGHEVVVLDSVKDTTVDEMFEAVGLNTAKAVASMEHKRYKGGVDLYTVFFTKLLCRGNTERANSILALQGINKKELSTLFDVMNTDSDFCDFIKALANEKIDVIIDELRPYVYGYEQIELSASL